MTPAFYVEFRDSEGVYSFLARSLDGRPAKSMAEAYDCARRRTLPDDLTKPRVYFGERRPEVPA